MKKNLKMTAQQRRLIEKKIKPWLKIRSDQAPPSGWIKAVRSSLGISIGQLAARLGIQHSAVIQLEKREPTGAVTLETLERVAHAMECKLVYALVPQNQYSSLDSILDSLAEKIATQMVAKIDHTMRLEKQGVDAATTKKQLKELKSQLKSEIHPSLWGLTK